MAVSARTKELKLGRGTWSRAEREKERENGRMGDEGREAHEGSW
jgi:hypothetical protein